MADKKGSLKGRRADLASKEVQDERFSKMFRDPRFKKFRKDQAKLKIDSRFQSMFKDPKFQINTSKFDSRGRLLDGDSGEDLKRFYELDDEAEAASETFAESHPATAKSVAAQPKKKDRAAALIARGDALRGKAPKAKANGKSVAAKNAKKAPPQATTKKKFIEFRGKRIEVDDDDDEPGPSEDDDADAASSGDGEDASSAEDEEASSQGEQDGADEAAEGSQDGVAQSDEEDELEEASDDEDAGEDQEQEDDDEDEADGSAAPRPVGLSRASRRARGETVSDDEDDEDDEVVDDSDGSDAAGDEAYDSSDIENVDPAALQAELAAERGEDLFAEVAQGAEEEEAPIGDATKRIAVLNCDWDHFKAVDLLAICQSFVPSGRSVVSSAIYLSDFGAERLKEEEAHGPVGIWKSKQRAEESDENNAPRDDDSKAAKSGKADAKGGSNGNGANNRGKGGKGRKPGGVLTTDEDEGYDPEKLRQYELDKLKYYYAVVECDSVETASHLYKQVDGMEVEKSSNVLDLRFVPDDLVMPRPPRDRCTEVPANYKFANFYTKALQHTRVECTWDTNTDVSRNQLLTSKQFSKDELAKNDFKSYLASDSDDDDDDESDVEPSNGGGGFTIEFDDSIRPPPDAEPGTAFEDAAPSKKDKIRKKFQSLIDSIRPQEDEGEEMEITFTPGLSEQAEEMVEKLHVDEARKEETVFERNMRNLKEKKKERRKQRQAETKADADDDKLIDDDDGPKNGKKPSKSGKRGKKAAPTDEEIKQRKQLELLMMPEETAPPVKKGYNLGTLKLEAATSKKKKREWEVKKAKSAGKEQFALDLKDERFSQLFTSSEFAMDPTAPQFKQTLGSKAIVRERVRQHVEERQKDEAAAAGGKKPSDLQALADSIKRKVQSQATKKQKTSR